MRPSRKTKRLLFLAAAIFVGSLLAAELLIRVIFPLPNGYFVVAPHRTEVYKPPTALFSNVSKVAKHTSNSQGVCGPELGLEPEYRILTIGGSTTACNALDAPKTWPARLEAKLSSALHSRRIWVGNLGKPGLNTRNHLVTFSRYLPQHPRIDAVVLLAGINDLLGRLAQDDQFQAMSVAQIESDPQVVDRAFAITPRAEPLTPWYRRLGLLRAAKGLRARADAILRPAPDQAVANVRSWRRNTRELRSQLPDLEPALAEYERNLETLLERGRSRGLRLIFMTQPVLWKREGVTPAEAETLMIGGVGRTLKESTAYYSPQALAEGMARYNDVMKKVCQRRNVECVDLARELKSDLSVFYDDCHFNISGAEQVAQLLANHLLNAPPLNESHGP
jgi:hypothetical protein